MNLTLKKVLNILDPPNSKKLTVEEVSMRGIALISGKLAKVKTPQDAALACIGQECGQNCFLYSKSVGYWKCLLKK